MWYVGAGSCFLLAVISHAFLCRLRWKSNRVLRFIMAGSLWGVVLLGYLAGQYGVSSEMLASLVLYAFVCELYIFVFASLPTSVTVALLLAVGSKQKTQAEIDAFLGDNLMVSMRLEGLLREGLLEGSPSQYVLTDKGKRLVHIFRLFQDFFGHSKVSYLAPRASKG